MRSVLLVTSNKMFVLIYRMNQTQSELIIKQSITLPDSRRVSQKPWAYFSHKNIFWMYFKVRCLSHALETIQMVGI